MEKVVKQEHIDSMMRAARGRGAASAAKDVDIKEWNCAESGQIGREPLRTITQLHEAFARKLTYSLGAYLRVPFDLNLISVEQVPYGEMLTRFPELTYLATAQILPVNASIALQMDLSVCFPIVDLLLGGSGTDETELREITEIEEQILDGVVRIVCKELGVSWEPVGQTISFEQRQTARQIQQLMAPNERTLSLSFEIRMAGSQGMLNMVCPSSVSNILTRKLAHNWAHRRPRGLAECSHELVAHLLECQFTTELSLASEPLNAQQLVDLVPGQTVELEQQVQKPVQLLVAGHSCFEAEIVRKGSWRAGHVRTRKEYPQGEKSV